MQQQNHIWRLPKRMGAAIASLFAREPYAKHDYKHEVVRQVQGERNRIPVDSGDADIFNTAAFCVREVFTYAEKYKDKELIIDAIALLCLRLGVPVPLGADSAGKIKRAVDKGWWVRSLRKEHARRFEHVAIGLGFTSYKAGIYLSNESAARQMKRNSDNKKLLEKTVLKNELGHEYTLAELSALGVSNKAIRRGELMTRIRGFEEIAKECGDVGMFWTVTAPSKYHAVLSKSGDTNPNYKGATPRDAQAYLCTVWKRIRSALDKKGIKLYGFRIAEPHHDGCPHWHLLLFCNKNHVGMAETTIRKYALEEDSTEKGAQENRVKLVRIEAGKGTAAGYIAKYVAKNIDGAHVGDHKTNEGWIVTNDLLGGQEITPSQRVTLWAQLHGIRQFQQIGGAPIGVWRELRRVEAERITFASGDVKAAWASAQRNGDELADFAKYLRAQGGATCGRNVNVRIATKEAEIVGRYETTFQEKPCGVYSVSNINAIYESKRYQWVRVDGVVLDVPWTGVNNCTSAPHWEKELKAKNKNFSSSFNDDDIKKALDLDRRWDFSRRYDWEGNLINE